MWYNLIKTCGQANILLRQNFAQKNILVKLFLENRTQQRIFASQVRRRNVQPVYAERSAVGENDAEYIVPYKKEYEARDTLKKIIRTLDSKFLLKKEEIEKIVANDIVLKTCREKSLMETLDLLCLEGVKKEYFVEYPWLITLDKNKLLEKLKLLKSLNGFRDVNDFVPFLRLHVLRLRRLITSLNRESNQVDYGNRVYFIAEQLKVSPATVTKYLVNRLFVLEINVELFKTNLQHMINYNVESMSILKDLWGFRYASNAIEQRLKRALQARKEKIMPWMVRCPEPVLQKSLQISLDELEVLGNRASVAEYVGERLGFPSEEAEAIMNKHPQVKTVRITKIKEVLDYLLDEEKFTRYEIAQVPRVLCHSLETTKERIEELKKYGCRPSSLVIVCRSKKEYEKFLKQWIANSKHVAKEQVDE